MSEESHMARPDTAGRGEARHGWARQGTELAPGVVRVGTDEDGTPIGTCWGEDKPAGWLWRSWRRDEDEEQWSPADERPTNGLWVQCRQPTTPPSTRAGDDVLDRAAYWLEHAPNHGLTHDYTRDLIMDLRDALNTAESSATRTETACSYGCSDDIANAECPMHGDPSLRASSPVVDREPAEPECVLAFSCWDRRAGGESCAGLAECRYTHRLAPSVPPVPQPEPDQPVPPVVAPPEYIASADWYRKNANASPPWERRSTFGWTTDRLAAQVPDNAPIVVRRADNENPRGTD